MKLAELLSNDATVKTLSMNLSVLKAHLFIISKVFEGIYIFTKTSIDNNSAISYHRLFPKMANKRYCNIFFHFMDHFGVMGLFWQLSALWPGLDLNTQYTSGCIVSCFKYLDISGSHMCF